MYSEGSRTWSIFGEGDLRDVFLEKVTFQLSPEGWLRGNQVKEKDEGRTFWAENEIVLFLLNQDLSCFNPKEWSDVGSFQICGRLLELGGGGSWGRGVSYSDCLAYFHANDNDVLSWFHSMNILFSPDLGQSKLEGNFEVIWGSEIANCKKIVPKGAAIIDW